MCCLARTRTEESSEERASKSANTFVPVFSCFYLPHHYRRLNEQKISDSHDEAHINYVKEVSDSFGWTVQPVCG